MCVYVYIYTYVYVYGGRWLSASHTQLVQYSCKLTTDSKALLLQGLYCHISASCFMDDCSLENALKT